MIFHKNQVVGRALAEKFENFLYEAGHWLRSARATLLAPWRFLKNVWHFRKELWRFRRWDYKFNNDLYIRSWELTAEHLDSDRCITTSGHDDAENIRKFIKLLRLSEGGIPEAERIMGVDFMDQARAADGDQGFLSNWVCNPKETWTEDQKKFRDMMKLVRQVEERSWKNAWKLMSRKGQHWWE